MFDNTAIDYGQDRGFAARRPGIYKDGKGGYVRVSRDRSVTPVTAGGNPILAPVAPRARGADLNSDYEIFQQPGLSTPAPSPSPAPSPTRQRQDVGSIIESDFLVDGLTTTALTPPASVKTETDTPDAPKPPGQRKNAKGIIQQGRDLSSSNLGRQLLLELPESDANRFIQSEGSTPAPGAGMNLNMPGISADTATVPFKVPDGAIPSFASELSPEVSDAVAFWKSQSSSPTLPSSYGTDFKPLSINTTETKAKPKSAPNPEQFGGVDPDTASLVSPMYANAARNAARSGFLDAPNSEGPMGTIRRRNAAVGLNAAGNIAKIDGENYNVSPDQAFALTGGAGNTREGLDAIKNAATPYVAPGAAVSNVSERFDTSKLNPAELAAVEATAQPIMGVQDLVPNNPNFSTEGMTDENAEEFMKRFRAALQAGA